MEAWNTEANVLSYQSMCSDPFKLTCKTIDRAQRAAWASILTYSHRVKPYPSLSSTWGEPRVAPQGLCVWACLLDNKGVVMSARV
jgi:hypothetical protein